MKGKSTAAGTSLKLSFFGVLAIWAHASVAAPNSPNTQSKTLQRSTGPLRSSEEISPAHSPVSASGVSNPDSSFWYPTPPLRHLPSQYSRVKRNLNSKHGLPDLSHLFQASANNEDLNKWLMLLMAKPKHTEWIDDCENEEDCEDYPAPIDLQPGKKPGYVDGFNGAGLKDGPGTSTWTGEDPIVLQQHRMKKNAGSSGPGPYPFRYGMRSLTPYRKRSLLSRFSFGRA